MDGAGFWARSSSTCHIRYERCLRSQKWRSPGGRRRAQQPESRADSMNPCAGSSALRRYQVAAPLRTSVRAHAGSRPRVPGARPPRFVASPDALRRTLAPGGHMCCRHARPQRPCARRSRRFQKPPSRGTAPAGPRCPICTVPITCMAQLSCLFASARLCLPPAGAVCSIDQRSPVPR